SALRPSTSERKRSTSLVEAGRFEVELSSTAGALTDGVASAGSRTASMRGCEEAPGCEEEGGVCEEVDWDAAGCEATCWDLEDCLGRGVCPPSASRARDESAAAATERRSARTNRFFFCNRLSRVCNR